MLSNVKAGGPYVMKIEKDCRHLLFELVPLPIINIVFGGHSHTERRPDSASTRGGKPPLAQHDCQGGVEVSNAKNTRFLLGNGTSELY